MTDWDFKNGIKIHIPEEATFRQWTDTKMAMDIIIGSPSKEPVNLYKIFETIWPPLPERPKATKRKSYHRMKKK